MQGNQTIRMIKLSPVLFVKEIRPCITFWKERLGFDVILESSDRNGPVFVVLRKDNAEIVMHTQRSLEVDVAALEPASVHSRIVLYMEVESLPEVLARVHDVEVVMPLRKSYYGAAEIAVREPGGHVVCFSQTNIPFATDRLWSRASMSDNNRSGLKTADP